MCGGGRVGGRGVGGRGVGGRGGEGEWEGGLRGRCAYLPRVLPLMPALSAGVVVLGLTPPQKEHTQKEKEKGAWRWVTRGEPMSPATPTRGAAGRLFGGVGWGGEQ